MFGHPWVPTLRPLALCGALALLSAASAAARFDRVAAADEAAIARALTAHDAARGDRVAALGAALAAAGEIRYPFFPQAGQPGADLWLYNFTDLDPASDAVRSWDCGAFTYDGHQGHDSLIRSFREQDIGVPVFAVLPAIVVDTHDGEFDRQVDGVPGTRANYVVLDHGGGYITLYYHLRSGSVAVAAGQEVAAGTQLGLTASSGYSSWPHLHFESRYNRAWFEPSAGPCRSGDSFWVAQPTVAPELAIADFAMGEGSVPLADRGWFIEDALVRRGTFVRGWRHLHQRFDVHSLPAQSEYLLRIFDPGRALVFEERRAFENPTFERFAPIVLEQDLDLTRTGSWRYSLELNGRPAVEVTFAVVATDRQVKNRAPRRITVRLEPTPPRAGEVPRCAVRTALAAEDPDFDVIAYRYEWRVGNRVVRALTSAATSDYLAVDRFAAGDRISCRVYPTDGHRRGPLATVTAVSE